MHGASGVAERQKSMHAASSLTPLTAVFWPMPTSAPVRDRPFVQEPEANAGDCECGRRSEDIGWTCRRWAARRLSILFSTQPQKSCKRLILVYQKAVINPLQCNLSGLGRCTEESRCYAVMGMTSTKPVALNLVACRQHENVQISKLNLSSNVACALLSLFRELLLLSRHSVGFASTSPDEVLRLAIVLKQCSACESEIYD